MSTGGWVDGCEKTCALLTSNEPVQARCRFVIALLLATTVMARAEDGSNLVLDVSGEPWSLTISAPAMPVSIERRLVIERAGPSGWQPLRVQFSTRSQCVGQELPRALCTIVRPDQPIVTAPWRGQLCADQCASYCRNNRLNVGHYRFVAQACGEPQVFRSRVFTVGGLPDLPDPASGIEPRR